MLALWFLLSKGPSVTVEFRIGDVFDRLAEIPDGSVDLVVTSPPFLALRSYLPADHPDKDKEIGSEATPAEFLDVMLRFTGELRRVLAPHGSIAIELGDTYAGGGNGPDALKPSDNGAHDLWKDDAVPKRIGPGWPLAKSKTLIPELYRIALAYGFNPLTGSPSPAGQWRIRNVVTWARPNPPVGALGDKWRPATSDVVVACVSDKRYWDDLATRRPAKPHSVKYAPKRGTPQGQKANPNRNDGGLIEYGGTHPSGAPLLDYWEIPLLEGEEPKPYGPKEPRQVDPADYTGNGYTKGHPEGVPGNESMPGNPAGAPLLDYWEIPLLEGEEPTPYGPKAPTKSTGGSRSSMNRGEPGYHTGDDDSPSKLNEAGAPLLDYWVIPPGGYQGSHYAVFPPELVVPLVKAMCPERVCRTCGEPSRRVVESDGARLAAIVGEKKKNGVAHRTGGDFGGGEGGFTPNSYSTLGWTDCGHDDYRPGLVLDPFAGSGTTLMVAQGHGHDAIGIDLDSRNAELALERVGPFFLQVVT